MDEPLDFVKELSSNFTPDTDLYRKIKGEIMGDKVTSFEEYAAEVVVKNKSEKKSNKAYLAIVAGFLALGGMGVYSLLGSSTEEPRENQIAHIPGPETTRPTFPETTLSTFPETTTLPNPETTLSTFPETTTLPNPETTLSTFPETTTPPNPETTLSKFPETTTPPKPETTRPTFPRSGNS